MHFREQEDAIVDTRGNIRKEYIQNRSDKIIATVGTNTPASSDQTVTEDQQLATALVAAVHIPSGTISAVKTGKRKCVVGPRTLAKNWGIGLDAAQRTVETTTQMGVRTILHPTLSRRFRTNDRQLRYRRLSHDMFTDTLEARTRSWFRCNKYAQVFSTKFGWVRVYPMQRKSQAHEALSLLAQREGVPPALVMDNAKEQIMGEFRRKAREMGCHVKQTEPYTPWSNTAEAAIREVKRGAGHKMAKTQTPSKLWDHCLELEGYIRSHTAINSFELQGQVPEMVLSGQTADISPFVELPWYGWVYYWDSKAQYPESKEKLGRWLGRSIDIGPAMMAKVLKPNGQLLHVSTYRPLSDGKMQDPGEKRKREQYDSMLRTKLGKPLSVADLEELGIHMPEYELHEDNHEGGHQHAEDAEDLVTDETLHWRRMAFPVHS